MSQPVRASFFAGNDGTPDRNESTIGWLSESGTGEWPFLAVNQSDVASKRKLPFARFYSKSAFGHLRPLVGALQFST